VDITRLIDHQRTRRICSDTGCVVTLVPGDTVYLLSWVKFDGTQDG
jgi:hypothetical protein